MPKSPSHNDQFYNVKVLRVWVSYFRHQLGWSEEKIESVFRYCESDSSFLESDDNWFGQKFADNFNKKAVELSGDPEISRKVGAYSTGENVRGLTGSLITSLLSASVVYKNIGRVASYYSKGARLTATHVSRERAVIRADIAPGCDEKEYQCQNRLGMLAAGPNFFGCVNVKIEHPTCYHRGDKYCKYIIEWKEPWQGRPWITVFGVAGVAGGLASLFFPAPFPVVSAVVAGALSFVVNREIRYRKMTVLMEQQTVALHDSVKTLERRYEESLLLRQVMRVTTEMRPIPVLTSTVTNAIHELMKYDRAMILLVDKEKQILRAASAHGDFGEAKALVDKAEFKIDPDNVSGHLIRVINTRKPMLVRDVQKNLSVLSERSQKLVRALGTDSFIAVPVMFKEEVLGVIAVETNASSKPLSRKDLDVLMSLSDHVAVAIFNARTFDSLRATLTAKERLSGLFQKYVPSEMRVDEFSEESELFRLQKKILSVMFIDIIGFTALSEISSLENIARTLNIFVEWVHRTIERHGGRINKIMGDGMLIYFDPNYSNAVGAGVELLDSLPKLNDRLLRDRLHPIGIGIGIHKGLCTIGNIGSKDRLDYTLLGDTVNVAARIESYTRKFGPNTLCFSRTMLAEAHGFDYEVSGGIRLKGHSETFQICRYLPGGVGNRDLEKVS